jgi:hypothetical protein
MRQRRFERLRGACPRQRAGQGGAQRAIERIKLVVLALSASSPSTTSLMLPLLVHTKSIALGCTMGDATATPTDSANHTSTKRVRCRA